MPFGNPNANFSPGQIEIIAAVTGRKATKYMQRERRFKEILRLRMGLDVKSDEQDHKKSIIQTEIEQKGIAGKER